MTKLRLGRRRPLAIVLACATIGVVTLAVAGSAQALAGGSSSATDVYIVQVAGSPLATYTGGVSGYAATRAGAGQRLDAHSPAARAYASHLRSQQSALLKRAGVDTNKTVYQYDTTFNGLAVRMTAAQAAKVQRDAGVVQVWKNSIVTTNDLITPNFIGLTGRNGVWQRQFGGDRNAGAGVIVADIDTGFWPASPSFAPIAHPTDNTVIAAKWHGTCDTTGESPVACNNKVIGARYFDSAKLSTVNPNEFTSPRDYDGHGSHTASTAAGDFVVDVTNTGNDLGPEEGVAPAARLAIYKVLYENATNTQASGSLADIAAAVDQAVADGVDVINMSLGGSTDQFSVTDVETLNAAAAGVFVSMSAGNNGPTPQTVTNDLPWETTVAAGTHDRAWQKTATLGNGASYTGVGVGAAVPSAPLIDSVDAGLAGQNPTQVTECFSGTLDPAKVTGKIVLCQRGDNARVDKSAAVKLAGGVGMILWNPAPSSLVADFHSVPTVHVDTAAGTAIKTYIHSTTTPTAALSVGTLVSVEAPATTDFSSRGPTVNSGGNLLKPDIMAPGNDVVAAVSPLNHGGNLYDSESGTSQAAPHITGTAALLLSKHPSWSPMWIKSAIMTTAKQVDNKGNPIQDAATGEAATPLAMGAGQVNPAGAFDPGLVYDSTSTQWLQFTCGIGIHLGDADGNDICDTTGAINGTDLNYPSISIGALVGKQKVTRSVTNITKLIGIYFPKVQAPAGYTASVSPSVLVVLPGRTAKYTVTVTRTTGAYNTFAFGSVTWSDLLGHKVRSPLAVQSVPLSAPDSATGTGPTGSVTVPATPGYTGTLTATGYGLAADSGTGLALVQDDAGFNPAAPAAGPGTGRVDVTVPAGTKLARFATHAADYAAGTDVDVFVYKKSGTTLTLVGQSAGSTADESVDITAAGDYAVFVDLFANPAGGTITVKEHQWLVPSSNAGNLTVTPASQSVTTGTPASVTVGWSGLTAGTSYLGVVEFGDGTNVVGDTTISVTA